MAPADSGNRPRGSPGLLGCPGHGAFVAYTAPRVCRGGGSGGGGVRGTRCGDVSNGFGVNVCQWL